MDSQSTFRLTSTAFDDQGVIPATYTCKGANISPGFAIAGVPDGSASLVLHVHDPDAPGQDWVHWLVWNIPPGTVTVNENSPPPDSETGTNDFGKTGWGGPCPPSGTHRYFFDLYALDTRLELPPSARWPDIERTIQNHVIEQVTLVGQFSASAP